jgi:hypothetical protein
VNRFVFHSILRAMNALARTTSPVDRLHDALVSLRFLIEVDVMAQSLDDVLSLDVIGTHVDRN